MTDSPAERFFRVLIEFCRCNAGAMCVHCGDLASTFTVADNPACAHCAAEIDLGIVPPMEIITSKHPPSRKMLPIHDEDRGE